MAGGTGAGGGAKRASNPQAMSATIALVICGKSRMRSLPAWSLLEVLDERGSEIVQAATAPPGEKRRLGRGIQPFPGPDQAVKDERRPMRLFGAESQVSVSVRVVRELATTSGMPAGVRTLVAVSS